LSQQSSTDGRPEVPDPVDYRDGITVVAFLLSFAFIVALAGASAFITPVQMLVAVFGESVRDSEWGNLWGVCAVLVLAFLCYALSWLTLRWLFARRPS
jgi:hypothetical protein